MLLNLFELEERNHTLKNILVIGVPEWKIFLSKLTSALVIVVVFTGVLTVYTVAGGIFLRNYVSDVFRIFSIYLGTSLCSICATMPVVLLIILLRKKYLIAMIAINCFVLIDFLFTWQLTMFNCLKIHLPILAAYRITYPFTIIEHTDNLQLGLDTLYYPTDKVIFLLGATAADGIHEVGCGTFPVRFVVYGGIPEQVLQRKQNSYFKIKKSKTICLEKSPLWLGNLAKICDQRRFWLSSIKFLRTSKIQG